MRAFLSYPSGSFLLRLWDHFNNLIYAYQTIQNVLVIYFEIYANLLNITKLLGQNFPAYETPCFVSVFRLLTAP